MSTMYEPTGNVISPVLPADFTAVSAVDVPAGMSSPLAVPPTDNASTMARTTIIARRNYQPPPPWFFRFLPFSSVLPSKDGIGFHARTMTPRIRISCEQQRYAQRREHVGRHHGQRNRTRVDDL